MKPTIDALIKRINRRLARKGEQLKISRGERAHVDLGEYYVIDTDRNTLVMHHVNPGVLARELEVLA